MRRVGHKGADHLAPGNTAASFDAALACGVDMIEFDVLPERYEDGSGPLFLAHDYKVLQVREPLTLEQGLDHLCAEAFAGVELDVDLKGSGYELRVVEALRERGLLERSLISSQIVESLALIRAHEPAVRLGWSVPRAKRDYLASPLWGLAARVLIVLYRRDLPRRARAALAAGRVDAIMAHRVLVGPRLVRAVRDAGGELYVWTVDDAADIARLERLGVSGVITNDPRLFAPPAPAAATS